MDRQPRINGVAISEAAIAAEMQHHPAASATAAWDAAARALAIRELLLQEVRRRGLEPAPEPPAEPSAEGAPRPTDEDALIGRLLDEAIAVPEADAETCRRYYDRNLARFHTPALFEAAHILLPAAPDDPAARAAATHDAEALIARLGGHPEEFADLARARSACPSAATGGSLGQVSRGQTVPELETFLFALEAGQLCPVPVPTRYGVHVLRLDRRIEGRQLPFEAVRDSIARYLGEAVWRRAVAQYVGILAGGSDIEGVDLAGSTTPLVQ